MRSIRHLFALVAVTFGVLLLAYACGSSSPATPTPTPSGGGGGGAVADVTITIVANSGSQSYSPNPAAVAAGKTVSWKNADAVAHTATADDGSFNTGTIAPGQTSAPITMSSAGSVGYHCAFHPGMVATLQVQ